MIHVGGNADFAPYEFVGSDGRPNGYTVELMHAAAGKVGLEARITLGPWKEMPAKLRSGQIDALSGLLYSEERDREFDFSVPHHIISYAIFIRKNQPYRSIGDFKGKVAVVVKNVYAHNWLVSNQFTSRIVTVKRPDEALRQLSIGRHDFAVLPRLHGLELMRQMKLKNIKTVGPPVLTQKFCFAVAAGNADLLARLNEGLSLLQKSGEYDRIFLKWFSLYEQKRRYWRHAALIGLVVLGFGLGFAVWNLTLKASVRRKTAALEKSRALLSQIIQGLPMPTFVVDRNNIVTHWNRACEALTGSAAEEIVGSRKHNDVFYGNRQLPLSEQVLDKQSLGESNDDTCAASHMISGACEAEFRFTSRGAVKWLYGTAAVLNDPEGLVIGAIESWQDLTEYKQMEAQLIQSRRWRPLAHLQGVSPTISAICSRRSWRIRRWRDGHRNPIPAPSKRSKRHWKFAAMPND